MLSKAYVQNIFDRSITKLETNGESYVLTVILPNTFCISVAGETVDMCVQSVKNKIYELESYLEKDRKHYGYDLENEYTEEN